MLSQKPHAVYMREWAAQNREHVNARRRERRAERIAAGDMAPITAGRERNALYHERHRDRLNAEAKGPWSDDDVVAMARALLERR